MHRTIAFPDLEYDKDQLREFVEDAVATDSRRSPRWYAITGSHLYGIESESSDIDIRGFHTVPAEQYAYLDDPKKCVEVNMGTVTDGFGHMPECDLRSSELRHFVGQVATASFNTIELVLHAPTFMNGVALEMDGLKSLIRDALPLDTASSYVGMAKSNYYNYLDPDKEEAYTPTPKKYLYVLRGLYAAQYLADTGEIEPNVSTLATEVDFGRPDMVAGLLTIKRDPEQDVVPERDRDDITRHIAEAFELVEFEPGGDKNEFRDRLDDWMAKLRNT